MRLWQDNCGNIIKETETAEDYLLLEIERLKEENAKLQEELKAEKENTIVRFVIGFNKSKETEYKVRLNDKKISVEALEEENE